MQRTLRLSPALQNEPEDQLEFIVPGLTLGECLENSRKQFPELNNKLWKQNRLNPQILFFHNNTIVRESDLTNVVRQRDVLDVIPAIEGG